jgi:hypothetical protein
LGRVVLGAAVLAVVSGGGAIVHSETTLTASATATPVVESVSVNPKSISFPNKAFADSGVTSKPVKVTVTNHAGSRPIKFLKPTVSAGFIVTSNGCVGELAPGKSCDLEVAYTPTMLGVKRGNLRINCSRTSRSWSVKLRGRGVAPAIKIKPKSLDFGRVPISTVKPVQSVTLSNPNAVAITLAVAPAATPPYNVTANTCGTLAAKGGTCTISVEFAPGSQGEFKGTLEIRDNGARSPQHVELLGIAK